MSQGLIRSFNFSVKGCIGYHYMYFGGQKSRTFISVVGIPCGEKNTCQYILENGTFAAVLSLSEI